MNPNQPPNPGPAVPSTPVQPESAVTTPQPIQPQTPATAPTPPLQTPTAVSNTLPPAPLTEEPSKKGSSNMRKYLLGVIVMVAIAAALLLAYTKLSPQSENKEPVAQAETVKTGSYQVELPDGWDAEVKGNFISLSPKGASNASIKISKISAPKGLDSVDTFANAQIDLLEASDSTLDVSDASQMTIYGEPGNRINYSYKEKSGDRRASVATVIKNGELFNIAFDAELSDYEGFEKDFDRILSTLDEVVYDVSVQILEGPVTPPDEELIPPDSIPQSTVYCSSVCEVGNTGNLCIPLNTSVTGINPVCQWNCSNPDPSCGAAPSPSDCNHGDVRFSACGTGCPSEKRMRQQCVGGSWTNTYCENSFNCEAPPPPEPEPTPDLTTDSTPQNLPTTTNTNPVGNSQTPATEPNVVEPAVGDLNVEIEPIVVEGPFTCSDTYLTNTVCQGALDGSIQDITFGDCRCQQIGTGPNCRCVVTGDKLDKGGFCLDKSWCKSNYCNADNKCAKKPQSPVTPAPADPDPIGPPPEVDLFEDGPLIHPPYLGDGDGLSGDTLTEPLLNLNSSLTALSQLVDLTYSRGIPTAKFDGSMTIFCNEYILNSTKVASLASTYETDSEYLGLLTETIESLLIDDKDGGPGQLKLACETENIGLVNKSFLGTREVLSEMLLTFIYGIAAGL